MNQNNFFITMAYHAYGFICDLIIHSRPNFHGGLN